MPSRRLPDFITAFLKYTENTESPRSYHLWAAISTVAATLQRRVWMNWGHTQIFPNQYVVLVGPSGIRKAEPLVVSKGFLRHIQGIHLVSEAPTRQALIRGMKNSVGPFTYNKRMIMQCPVAGVFEEFAVFLGEGDAKFLAWLTNWYDSRDRFTYDTKNAGVDEILGVCMNILGSTAPDWIPLMIPFSAIGGGFTSRILFVVEHHKARVITNPNEIEIDRKLEKDMIHDLEQIYSIRGEYVFTPGALALYEAWYQAEEDKTSSGHPAINDPRFSGYVSRRATHIKKIAMASTASRSNEMAVSDYDFTRSLQLMESVEDSMPAVFTSVGRSQYSVQTDSVMEFIRSRGEVKKSELLRLLYYDIDVKTLEVVEENLVSMQLIKRDIDTAKADKLYTWIGGDY